MTNQHDKFLSRLDKSRHAVFKVGEYLHKNGYTVKIPAIRYAPTAADHSSFVDEGDIIASKNGEPDLRIEVKHIFTDFTDRKSWPFPIAFVSNVAAVDRAKDSVTAYILVNRFMTHIAIVWTKTKHMWKIVETRAKNTNNIERNYGCNPDLLDFREL